MRQPLHQLPVEALKTIWRDFEPSDYDKHRKCGYIPTSTHCHVCGKKIGESLERPYSYQLDVLEDDHLTCQIAGGEQVGKSHVGAMKAYATILGFLGEYGPSGRASNEVAWLLGLSYQQCAKEFEYLKIWLGQTHKLNVVFASEKVDPGEIHIQVPGGLFKIKTKSVDDPMAAIRMESPVVALVCEAALVSFDAYIRIRSRVGRSRKDFPGYGAIFMTSTFEGSTGWYATNWSRWQMNAAQVKENAKSFSLPSFANVFTYSKGEKDPEIVAMRDALSEDEYKERVLAVPSPPKGRVFGMFDPELHVLQEDHQYDPEAQVYIGIDPGYSAMPSAYAVEVFQRRYLPCGKLHYAGIDEIFEWKLVNLDVVRLATQRPWWKNEMKTAVIDQAGERHAGAQNPAAMVWRKEAGLPVQSEYIYIMPGRQRMAAMLNICPDANCPEPLLVFSPCQEGVIAEFSGSAHPFDGQSHPYRWQTDRTGQVVGHVPKDEYCDGIKATTYLFYNLHGPTNHERGASSEFKVTKREYAIA